MSATASHRRMRRASPSRQAFSGPVFHEFVLRFDTAAREVLQALQAQSILGGLALAQYYPELGDSLLVCATETKQAGDLERYADSLRHILVSRSRAAARSPNPPL